MKAHYDGVYVFENRLIAVRICNVYKRINLWAGHEEFCDLSGVCYGVCVVGRVDGESGGVIICEK